MPQPNSTGALTEALQTELRRPARGCDPAGFLGDQPRRRRAPGGSRRTACQDTCTSPRPCPRRAAVRQHVRGCEPGILLRRHDRRDHFCAREDTRPASHSPHLRVPVQGKERGRARGRRGAGSEPLDRRFGSQGGRSRPHQRPARSRQRRRSGVVRAVRPSAHGHFCNPRRHRPGDRCSFAHPVGTRTGRKTGAEPHERLGILSTIPSRPRAVPRPRGRNWSGDFHSRASRRPRSGLCAGLGSARTLLLAGACLQSRSLQRFDRRGAPFMANVAEQDGDSGPARDSIGSQARRRVRSAGLHSVDERENGWKPKIFSIEP